MSFDQLFKRHYETKTKKTAYNQLLRLKKGGFIESKRVGLLSYQRTLKNIGNVVWISRKGVKVLETAFPSEIFREPFPLNTATLYHDLVLNEAILALKKKTGAELVVNGKHEFRRFIGEKRFPDALVLNPSGQIDAAVELELSAKSERRYREIIIQYRLSLTFPKVLYVVGSKTIEEKIKSVITHKTVGGLATPPTGKFYFVGLNDLLDSPTAATISNGRDQILDTPELKSDLREVI